uniref:O-glucosyltransferase rumi homolog n=1 Tax=Rhizophora mucronata TaxID=61149 RepID=A0A2P2JTW3_RHIMU
MQPGSSDHGGLKEAIWWPVNKLPARSCTVFLLFLFLLVGALVTLRVLDYNTVFGDGPRIPNNEIPEKAQERIEVPFNCTAFNLRGICPTILPTNVTKDPGRQSPPTCPEYFRWIHEDLRPWSRTGISRDMVERAKTTAHFRLVVMNGKAYVERYHRAYQTRDVFTLWGILQLLRRYPGKVPDLELMFDLEDRPYIKSRDFSGPNAPSPPALFKYCADDESLDIVFPDWSFWGWPEVNIKPWGPLLKDFAKGKNKTKWMAKTPYAHWRGNPDVSPSRQDLLKCNVSRKKDWNARLYRQV